MKITSQCNIDSPQSRSHDDGNRTWMQKEFKADVRQQIKVSMGGARNVADAN